MKKVILILFALLTFTGTALAAEYTILCESAAPTISRDSKCTYIDGSDAKDVNNSIFRGLYRLVSVVFANGKFYLYWAPLR